MMIFVTITMALVSVTGKACSVSFLTKSIFKMYTVSVQTVLVPFFNMHKSDVLESNPIKRIVFLLHNINVIALM